KAEREVEGGAGARVVMVLLVFDRRIEHARFGVVLRGIRADRRLGQDILAGGESIFGHQMAGERNAVADQQGEKKQRDKLTAGRSVRNLIARQKLAGVKRLI